MYESIDINIFEFIDKYHSYFIKANSGYSFSATKFGYDSLSGYKDFNIIVSDGKIVECANTWNDGSILKFTFTDFGTTEFELTDEMLQVIEDYNNNIQ